MAPAKAFLEVFVACCIVGMLLGLAVFYLSPAPREILHYFLLGGLLIGAMFSQFIGNLAAESLPQEHRPTT